MTSSHEDHDLAEQQRLMESVINMTRRLGKAKKKAAYYC
jgi:hypothetical protein